jgi:two-component system response regulator AtoC
MSDAVGKNSIQSVEARCIAQLLEEHNGHRRKVAEILNVSERTLYRKLVNYNLTKVGKQT